ncbi:MAG: ATPase [Erysipelotrichaceae bacterium]|jgi:V/A-type H+-transporting ATPase subunit K|nr:ATPase [Erysipelotrichaceae bacterium]
MLSLTEILLPVVAVLLIVGPLALIFSGRLNAKNAKHKVIAQICIFTGVFAVMVIFQAHQFTALAADTAAAADTSKGLGFIAAAIAVSCSSLGAGLAVAKATPAALGAVSENPDNFGRALIFVALGEGIAIYGLLISILILNNL